ncbi:hypothetical protein, conserved [Babesia ovata]|uniref:C3H1-type domain-containing protein n=1 Tax=Babesia ovata TaxID=189622 RepID=A0A2H6KAH7_9APIC|nr:uncharacterized protein BOVATA_014860 [Babesia ovata]GBE59993.1 hypothetical protein, conserved [Babesia ovata]
MSFLHGVLHNIQPKLGQHKDSLNSALSELKSTKLNGITKYKAAIAAVAGGVRAYNVNVSKSNDAVKSVVTTLQKQVDESFKKAVSFILNDNVVSGKKVEPTEKDVTEAERQINEKLQQCKKNAETFTNNLDTENSNIKESINDLNAKLKDKLESVRKTVQYESGRLETMRVQHNSEFEKTKSKISDALSALQTCVNNKISEDVKKLLDELTRRVQEILKELQRISKDLSQRINELQEWIRKADGIVDEAIQGASKIADKNHVGWLMEDEIKRIAEEIGPWSTWLDGYIPQLTKAAEQVKTAVQQIDVQLKTDLGRMEWKIYEPVSTIKSNSEGFLNKFRATKGALDTAIGKVFSDMEKFKELNDIEDLAGKMEFLKSLNGEPFGALIKYFKQLEDKVMTPVKEVMAEIGKGIRLIGSVQPKDLDKAFASLKLNIRKQLQEVQKVLNAAVPSPDIQGIAIVGVDMKNVTKLDLARYTKHIQTVISRLNGSTEVITKDDIRSLLTHLGSVAQDVTKHSEQVVTAVMQKIREKVKEEVKSVAEAIKEKLEKIKDCVDSVKEFDVDYGGKKPNNNAKGLKMLVNTFENTIKNAIDGLAASVGSTFKKTQENIGQEIDVEGTLTSYKAHKTSTLAPAVDAIKGEANVLEKDSTKEKRKRWSADITSNLSKLIDAFKKVGTSLNEKVKQLHTMIGKKEQGVTVNDGTLQKIYDQLAKLQNEMDQGPIKNADYLIKYIDHHSKDIVDQLTRHVKQEVNSAQAKLTTHARRQYVEALKFALQQFAEKVTGELSELPGLIENDKHIGLKGFMEAFYGANSGDNINKLENPVDLRTVCHSFEKFLGPLNTYIIREIDRLKEEEHKKNPSLQKSQDPYSKQLNKVYSSLSTLITHIYTKNKYDNELPTKLAELTATLSDLKLDGFPNPVTVMLGGISGGCRQLVEVLGDVYISRYDGAAPVTWKGKKADEISQEGKNCGKVFLTSVMTLFNELYHLFNECTTKWQKCSIQGGKNGDDLRKYLESAGYKIDNLNKQYSALRVTGKLFDGFNAYGEFNKVPSDFDSLDDCVEYFRKHDGPVAKLFDYLHKYFTVSHISIPSSRHPSSVYDMLRWLTGLTHNPVYPQLSLTGFSDLFEKPEKKPGDSEGDDIAFDVEDPDTLEAYPENVTASQLSDSLAEVCHYSYDVLISFLGYGHADGIYAVDFNTNPDKFSYPSNPGACIQLLAEILNRLFHQLRFLFEQCCNGTSHGGWAECHYGQGVGGSAWKCNQYQCPDQMCDQMVTQKCKQHPKCGVKSPLQSFLEDGLPGFLPHPYSKSNCKVSCDAPNHRGVPCKTPMGFADISVTASRMSKGSRLYRTLKIFCGTSASPLTKLCSKLTCVLSRPPQTLDDMFGFYQKFLSEWASSGPHRRDAFEDAVNRANFERPYKHLNVSSIFHSTHSVKSKTHTTGDLISLVCGSKTAATCGLYLNSISNDISGTFSKKHAGRYLSWIVYITETFYDLLKKLYDDCSKTCGGDKARCRIAKCPQNCNFNDKSSTANHDPSCKSIIQCSTTSSVLCKYGFMLLDRKKLNGTDEVRYRRTCNDFCNVLEKVLDAESVLVKLFDAIDEFLKEIRFPFMSLLLSLWSLSLLYLLHIAVVRLDVLRIRSHLRSPASHRIAAQSLLAAARVKALNNVKYFSP